MSILSGLRRALFGSPSLGAMTQSMPRLDEPPPGSGWRVGPHGPPWVVWQDARAMARFPTWAAADLWARHQRGEPGFKTAITDAALPTSGEAALETRPDYLGDGLGGKGPFTSIEYGSVTAEAQADFDRDLQAVSEEKQIPARLLLGQAAAPRYAVEPEADEAGRWWTIDRHKVAAGGQGRLEPYSVRSNANRAARNLNAKWSAENA